MYPHAHLDIHQIVDANATQFWELLPTFLKERRNGVPLLALCDRDEYVACMYLRGQARYTPTIDSGTYHDTLAMPASVPVRIRDLDVLRLELLLLPEPLLPELLALTAFGLFPFPVGEEGSVDLGVLAGLGPLHWRLVAVLGRVPALVALVVVASS